MPEYVAFATVRSREMKESFAGRNIEVEEVVLSRLGLASLAYSAADRLAGADNMMDEEQVFGVRAGA